MDKQVKFKPEVSRAVFEKQRSTGRCIEHVPSASWSMKVKFLHVVWNFKRFITFNKKVTRTSCPTKEMSHSSVCLNNNFKISIY